MLASFVAGGACVFCDPLGPKNVVIAENDIARIWPNPFPDKAAKGHWVMAPKRHLLPFPIKLESADFEAMGKLFVWLQQESDASPLFGDPHDHWEAHLIVPDRSGDVRFKLGSGQGVPEARPERIQGGLQSGYWQAVQNPNPLPHTRLHLLFRQYPENPLSLNPQDFVALYKIFFHMVLKHGIEGGGFVITNCKRTVAFAMRFGLVKYNEGSVPHQHANVFVATLEDKVVEIPFGKNPAKIAEALQRMLIYEEIRNGKRIEDLSPEQAALVKDRLK